MDKQAKRHLERLLKQIHGAFTDVQVRTFDISERRAVLQVRCTRGDKTIAVTEVLTPDARKYSYYLIQGDKVLIGLDNSADRRALRLMYGRDFPQHIHEPIPHRHVADRVELTDKVTFAQFIDIVTASDVA